MKHRFYILMVFISIISCKKSEKDIILETINRMNTIETIRYESTFSAAEKDKVLFSRTNNIFFDFTDISANGLKYHFKDKDGELIFNGKKVFQSDNEKRIITTEDNPDALNPIIATIYPLKFILPKLIDNKNVEVVKEKDTIIQSKKFYRYNFKLTKSYIDWMKLDIINNTDNDAEFALIIDKSTYLPKVIITQSGKKSFISRTIDNIDLNFRPKKGLWSGANLPTDYPIYEWNDYKERKKTKLMSFIGKSIGSLELPTILDNDSIKMSELLGKVILLEFWFKGCGACQKAIPKINKINDRFKNKQFKLYGIEFIGNYSKNILQDYVKESGRNYPSLYQGKTITRKLGISSAPTYLIINKGGEIIQIENGISEDNIARIIKTIEQNL